MTDPAGPPQTPQVGDPVSPAVDHPPAPARPVLEEVYRAQFSYVWHAARRVGIAHADLEDVVQEVFMVVARKLPEFDPRRPIKPWLFGILYRVALDWRRRAFRVREVASSETPTAPSHLRTDQGALHNEQRALVAAILDGLDWDKRVVLVMHEFQEMNVPEVAEVLGIPLNTAYSRLRLARRDFAAAARARGEGGGP